MARLSIITLLIVAGSAVAQLASSGAVQETREAVVEATQKELATGLRGGNSNTPVKAVEGVQAAELSKWDTAPKVQKGAQAATALLIGVPVFLLLIMLVAKRNGGFYPAGCFCFFVLVLFTYFMVKS